MWKVPLFDLSYDEEEENAVLDVLRSKWFTSGPKTRGIYPRKSLTPHCDYLYLDDLVNGIMCTIKH